MVAEMPPPKPTALRTRGSGANNKEVKLQPGELAPKEDETEEEKEARFEKMKRVVAQTPGAQVVTEGMKMPGQEEREAREAEWMRGEFDPCGDLVVTGMRLERGEGRPAEDATGPQPDNLDDLFITLRGTPVAGVGDEQPFFAPRGMEAALANRLESQWLVQLSDPRLPKHWKRSLVAMSRGDWCRFTCAAKKAQEWLQALADVCEPLGGVDGSESAEDSRRDTRVQLPCARLQIQPCGRDTCVEVRLDKWLTVTNVAKKIGTKAEEPTLLKRLLGVPQAVLEEMKMSKDEMLQEQLRHAGDHNLREGDEMTSDRMRREPRAPDRVRVQYALRKLIPRGHSDTGWTTLASNDNSRPFDFTLGGGGGRAVGKKAWPIMEECVCKLEAGERASFTFVYDGSKSNRLSPDDPIVRGGKLAEGDTLELDLRLVTLLKQKDVSRKRDLSATRCRLITGEGFWKPREHYSVTISAAPAPSASRDLVMREAKKTPKTVHTYTLSLSTDPGVLCAPLCDLLMTMSIGEAAILTAERTALSPWPAGGPLAEELPPAADDGSTMLWVRLDDMTRVEKFGTDGDVTKTVLNGEPDRAWLEKAFVDFKGEMPFLEEDVAVLMAVGATDGDGKQLFAQDRQVQFRTGDMPLADDWVLIMLMQMYEGERAKVSCTGDKAAYLLDAVCQLRQSHGGCPLDRKSASEHVSKSGLELAINILQHRPPEPKDGVDGATLLASAEDLKNRANALLTGGKPAGAMRKYVRAVWLMQDGQHKEDPAAPMTEVVGIQKGDPPYKTRFGDSQAAAVKALRVSLHLNLANGALKLSENYGALAAAQVARELEPRAVKPLYREAQAHLALQDYESARECLKTLLEIEPQNKDARRLLGDVKTGTDALKASQRKCFTGMFSRAQKQGAPLYSKDEIHRTTEEELKRTQYVRDRAEERRRGMQMLNVQNLSRLPEEYQQKQIDEMNEAIENDARISQPPEGMTTDQFNRLLQMRTDGEKEEKIQAEIGRMRREETAAVKKHMTRAEIERMAERQSALERDRYKSDDVLKEREEELWDEFKEIKRRVERRVPLYEAEQQRQEDMMRECQAVLEDEEAEEEDKARAMRRMLHDPFKDLDKFLSDAEMYELNELKSNPSESDPRVQQNLQRLLNLATERRIEAQIDELLDKEDDVLV